MWRTFFVLGGSVFRFPWLYSGGGVLMTNPQKEKIALMRSEGASCAQIAEALGLSTNTIKSYCQRNRVRGDEHNICEQCKRPMKFSIQPARRFCCDACRMAWWKSHPEKLNHKAVYHFTCAFCRKKFTAYGNKCRKYCSRACYGKSKTARAHQAVAS